MASNAKTDAQSRHAKVQRQKFAKKFFQYLSLTVVTAIFFAPIYYMIIGSFKPSDKVLDGLAGFLPRDLSFDNYVNVFTRFDSEATGYFWQFYATSITVSAVIVIGGLVVNSMAAFALARLRWRGQKAVMLLVVLLVILPFEAIAVPLFSLLGDYRNTLEVQFVPFIASAFSIFLFYTFFIGLPAEIQEAARLDGAGPFKTFFSIIVPMSKPVFASVTILSFLAAWNSFLFPLMMVDQANVRPLPLAMTVFYQEQQKAWGNIFAFGVLLIIPVMIVFLAFQKFFVQSVASSAVKG
jgi:multiple sugar transport system permease protein